MSRSIRAFVSHPRRRKRHDHLPRTPRRGLLRLLIIPLLAWAAVISAGEPDPILFESSAPGIAGGGLSIGTTMVHGHTFRVGERVHVSSVGSQFSSFINVSIFAALYKVGTPVSPPEAVGDSTLLATTLLDVPGGVGAVEVSGAMDIVLEPGWYALAFGTGRHGATANAFNVTIVPTGNPTTPRSHGPYSVNLSTGNLTLQGTQTRFFVRGQILAPSSIDPTDFVFQTTRPWAWWGSGSLAINTTTFLGQRFTLTRPARIGRVSTWVWGHPAGGGHGEIFAAIFPIAHANAFPPVPSHPDFESQALASALIAHQPVTEEYHADFADTELPPGHYALVFGSGRFGASGQVNLLAIGDEFVAPGALWHLSAQSPSWFHTLTHTFSMRLTGTFPEIALADEALDFGDVLVDDVGQRAATLINLRDHDVLAITGMQLLGDDADQFVVADDADECATIAIGASCGFTIEYRPQQAGPHHATLSIASDGSPSPIELQLDGNGLPSAWVTPSAGTHGDIQPDAPQLAGIGDTVTFEMIPDIGYHVDTINSSCGGGLAGSTFTTATITADCTVEASFAINLYALDYDAGPNGTVDGDTAQTVAHGGDGTPITAQPHDGYHFAQWSDGNTDNPRTDTGVAGPISVRADFAINTYTLDYGAVAHGSIDGNNPQTVPHGNDGTPVTAVPDAGYRFVQWSDDRTDNPRTDTNVTAALSVDAEFELNTYTVTPSAGGNGSISPDQPQTLQHGDTASFQVVPDEGYVAIVAGSCGGDLVGTTYTTDPVADDCTVDASFVAPISLHIVSGDAQSAPLGAVFAQTLVVRVLDLDGDPVADADIHFEAPASGPSTSPNQTVVQTDANGQAQFQARANLEAGGYSVTVDAPTFPAATAVTFGLSNRMPAAALTPSIDSGRDYARYGQVVDYLVHVENSGPDPVAGLSIDVQFSESLNAVSAIWQCLTPSTGCTASGTGTLNDSGLSLPAGQAAIYLLSAPVLTHPDQHLIRADLGILAPGISESAFDTSTLVIMRNGFNAAQDDRAQHSPWQPSDANADAIPADTADLIDGDVLTLPDLPLPGNGIATLWRTPAGTNPSLRVDRLQHGDQAYLRIVATDASGEHASAWIGHVRGAAALLSRHDTVDGTGVMLSSGDHSTDVLLMHDVDDPP